MALDARRLVDPARERPARRPPGAVPGRAARAADPAVHVQGRPRARPVHGQRFGARRRGAPRAPLRRLRPRPAVRRDRPPPRRRRSRAGRRRGRGPTGRRRSTVAPAARTSPMARQPTASPRRSLVDAGFTIHATDHRVRRTGVTVSFVATDADGDALVLRRRRRVHHPSRRAAPRRDGVEVARPGATRSVSRARRRAARVPHQPPAAPAERGRHRSARRRSRRVLRRHRPALARESPASGELRRGRSARRPTAGLLDGGRARPLR